MINPRLKYEEKSKKLQDFGIENPVKKKEEVEEDGETN